MSEEKIEKVKPVIYGTPEELLKSRPFPYYPPAIPIEESKRMEIMMELNKWSHNDQFMATRSAETLILLLAEQFNINLLKLNQ